MPGVKQKLAQASQLDSGKLRGGEDCSETHSVLCLELLHNWTMGHISAVGVQKLAAATLLDGVSNNSIAELAALGAWGQHKNHIHKELTRLVSKDLKLAEPILVSCPCLNNKEAPPVIESAFPILAPHLLFHSLQENYPDSLQSFFGASRIQNFWSSVRSDDPRLCYNRVKDIPGYETKFIPLWLHGDGVEFSSDSILAFSIGSMLATGASMDTSAFIAACPKRATAEMKQHGVDTWSLPYKVITWSLQALWEGAHPVMDWEGKPFKDGSLLAELAGKSIFQGGFRCLVWSLLGDLDYFANDLGFPHWSRHEFCWMCNCSKVDMTRYWMDFRDDPNWVIKTADELRDNPPTDNLLVLGIPGVMAGFLPALDILHTIDQGVAVRLAGGVLHCWCYDGPSSEAAGKLQSLWCEVQAAYGTLGTKEKLTNLILSMFTNVKSPHAAPPVLKCKAAECRHLIPALALVARSKVVADCPLSVHIAASLECLSRFYFAVTSSTDIVLPEAIARQAESMLNQCLLHCSWLYQWSNANDNCKFHLVPKHHFAKHLAASCKFLNPVKTWTYKSEDWVGQLSTIALSCSHGTSSHAVPVSLMQKYRLMFHLRLKHSIFVD